LLLVLLAGLLKVYGKAGAAVWNAPKSLLDFVAPW